MDFLCREGSIARELMLVVDRLKIVLQAVVVRVLDTSEIVLSSNLHENSSTAEGVDNVGSQRVARRYGSSLVGRTVLRDDSGVFVCVG